MFRFLVITKQMEKWAHGLSSIFPESHKCISTFYAEIRSDFITFIIIPSILPSRGLKVDGVYIDYDTVDFGEDERTLLMPCVRYGFIAPIEVLENKFYGKI